MPVKYRVASLLLLLLAAKPVPLPASEPPAERTEGDAGEPRIDSDLREQVEVQIALPPVDDIASFSTTIDLAELPGRGADLSDVLRGVPGARVRDYGGLGQYATVSLRASSAEQVTVFIDGVPQNRALSGAVDLSSVPATQIARITVFRGFGPAALGLGGLGGVIDIRTRAPGPEPEGAVNLLYGGLDSRRLSTSWSLRVGRRGTLRIGAEALASNGDFTYLDTNGTQFEPADDRLRRRENNDLRQVALVLQGVWRELGGGRLRVASRLQDRERGLPGIDGLPARFANTTDDYADVLASWSRPTAGGIPAIEVMVDAFRQRTRVDDRLNEFRLGAPVLTTRLAGGGLGATLRSEVGVHQLLFRLEARHERARVRDDALVVVDRGGGDRRLLSATVEDVIRVGSVSLAPSMRWDHIRDVFLPPGGGSLPAPAADREESSFAGKLGVAWGPGPRAVLRASLGRFQRYPTVTELFGDSGAVVGNPALIPERGWSAELGGSWTDDAARLPWSLELVAFSRDVDDMILLRPSTPAVSRYQNLGRAEVRGLEASAALRPWRGLTLSGSATYQRALDRSGKPLFDGQQIAYQPEYLGRVGAAWERSRIRAGWELTYVGENLSPADPEQFLPARVLHDVRVSYTWPGGIELGLDARNLFDRRTRDVASYPLPGRVVFVHLGWTSGPRREAP